MNTTTATPTPEALAIAVIFKDFAIDHTPDGWPAVKQMHLNAAAAELERQHAEIERLTAENEAVQDAVSDAVAAEREACAEIAADEDHIVDAPSYYAQLGDAKATARNIEKAIRARGTP